MESSAWSQLSICNTRMHNSPTMVQVAKVRWIMDMESSAWSQLTNMLECICNSPTIIARSGWRMEMKSSVWSQYQYARMHNSQSVDTRAGWGMDMELSVWSVTNVPECTAHLLCEDWTWNHQHGHSHQCGRMHNLHTMVQVAIAGWIMGMELSAWSWSPLA